ncbi:MAG: hypothetical protein P1P84_21240 [Deferrisomatales bacterium]|nr:hypothetical protein [Deferrisomatales bacterium]
MYKPSCGSPGHRRSKVVFWYPSLLAGFLLVAGAVFAGGPPAAVLDKQQAKVKRVMGIQEDVTPFLMVSEDVLGTATGVDEDGEVVLVVYVNQRGKAMAELVRALPKAIRGAPVVVETTEPFRALRRVKTPSVEVSHTAPQASPIQLGTSGGWGQDLANGYCCGGTLGALVEIDGAQHILSNYHVFEADIVPGGNGDVATTGDPVLQPGLIDVSCNAGGAQAVATLVMSTSLPGSNVDAAVARVVPGMVSPDGAILEIGVLSAQTADASLRQKVKKSGRTTGLTRSTVSGLNATLSVAYDDECAGGTAFTKVFTGQIVVKNRDSSFLAGGDSGAVLVEDVAADPRAVGLLYAGSSTLAVANPIDDVLQFLGATMVGQ